MPITLITGTPGAGKTLRALQRVLTEAGIKDQSSVEAIRRQLAQVNRRVVVCGVEGLQPGIFDTIDDPGEWQDLEDGTLVLVDEAWKWWGSHITAARTDQRVLDLAVHRHRGFDFVITCQQPSQLQPHVRGLIGEHLHVTRKFGTNTTVCYEWPNVQDSPNGQTAKGQGIETVWSHPRPIFDLYQSATQHTIKRKLPWKIIMVPVIGLAALGLLGGGGYMISRLGKSGKDGATAAVGEDAPAAAGHGQTAKPLTPAEYAEQRLPRFATMPETAPIYDQREVVAMQEVFCIASGPGKVADGSWKGPSVTCLTEQGTRYELSAAEARAMARHGRPYNFFKEPSRSAQRAPEAVPSAGVGAAHGDALNASVMSAPQIGAYGDHAIAMNPGSAP